MFISINWKKIQISFNNNSTDIPLYKGAFLVLSNNKGHVLEFVKIFDMFFVKILKLFLGYTGYYLYDKHLSLFVEILKCTCCKIAVYHFQI